VLDQTGRYRAAPIDENGIYRSTILADFWFKEDWLWLKQKLSPLRLLAEIIGQDRLIELLRAEL
jgi:hypothetical protein